MKKQEFLNDVAHEIKTLKKLATKEELAKLDFSSFNNGNVTKCIYGQITGNCASKRAKILMDKACIRVMDLASGVDDIKNQTFNQIKDLINGKNTGQGWYNSGGDFSMFGSRSYSHLSALEGYITLKGAKNEHIIKYLKGEDKTLKL